MIKVQRVPKPAVLVKKEAEWLQHLSAASTPAAEERATAKYRHAQIRKALEQMLHGKCAYCESKVSHVSYSHIEHFRPKSNPAYRSLTFAWDNLLLSCGVCNSREHKGDRFPEADQDGPLINPCDDDPEDHLTFRYDPVARLASVYGKTPRGNTTESVLGLNRPELRAYRTVQVVRLAALARLARTDPQAKQLVEEAQRDDAEYAAFARTLRP